MRTTLCLMLCFCSILSFGQPISIKEVISIRKFSYRKVDSLLNLKGFTKIKDDTQPGFRIVVYSYVKQTDTAIDRYNVVFGERFKLKISDLDFVVWQKTEAGDIGLQLLLDGFKKKVTKLPSLDNHEPAGDFITYEKGNLQINYTEEEHYTEDGKAHLTYVFRLSN